MKKTIQILLISILSIILVGLIIFLFNPLNLRNKIIGSAINYYLQTEIPEAQKSNSIPKNDSSSQEQSNTATETDKNPLLNEEQEKTLESYGVDVESLPSEITPGMEACFKEKIGEERTQEIVEGSSPTGVEIFKTRECLSK